MLSGPPFDQPGCRDREVALDPGAHPCVFAAPGKQPVTQVLTVSVVPGVVSGTVPAGPEAGEP